MVSSVPGEIAGGIRAGLPAPGGGLFDTHCHLDAAEFDADRAQVLADAVTAGLGRMLVPAVEVANFAAVRALRTPSAPEPVSAPSGRLPQGDSPQLSNGESLRSSHRDSFQSQKIMIDAAFGIHPLYTPRAREEDIAELRRWLLDEQPVAIGEIGLDGFVPGLDMGRQEWFLVEQLKLARELDLPVVLHIRRAQDLVLKYLRKIRVRGGIAHAFNGSRQQAEEFIKLGFKLGFGGAMTFSGSTRIRALAADLPLDAIVLETDAPDIPPAWLNGGRNAPAELARIARVLAELRGLSVDQVARATANAAHGALGGR